MKLIAGHTLFRQFYEVLFIIASVTLLRVLSMQENE